MNTLLLAAALSLLIGLSLGLLGGGGSILTVPILIYVLGVEPKSAIATSLLVVGLSSAVGAVGHHLQGRVRWRTGALFGAAGMVGSFAAGRVAHHLPARALLLGFTAMMLVTALAMLRGRRAEPEAAAGGELPVAKALLTGVGVGAVTGLVGAGGGFVVVPTLVLLGHLPMSTAVGTSLLVIAMQSLAGFLGYLGGVAIDARLTALVIGAAMVGVLLGGRLTSRVSPQALRRAFGWFVLGMGIFMLFKQLGVRS